MKLQTLMIACLAALPFAGASVPMDLVDYESAVGTAPYLCQVGGPCVGAGCASLRETTDACATGKCGWIQQWQVEGGYDQGTGNVTFRVRCGDDDKLVDCKASIRGVDCRSDIRGPGKGDFGCLFDPVPGVKDEDIHGFCRDPANPEVIYLAAPSGTPYEIAKYAVDLGQVAEEVALRALP